MKYKKKVALSIVKFIQITNNRYPMDEAVNN